MTGWMRESVVLCGSSSRNSYASLFWRKIKRAREKWRIEFRAVDMTENGESELCDSRLRQYVHAILQYVLIGMALLTHDLDLDLAIKL